MSLEKSLPVSHSSTSPEGGACVIVLSSTAIAFGLEGSGGGVTCSPELKEEDAEFGEASESSGSEIEKRTFFGLREPFEFGGWSPLRIELRRLRCSGGVLLNGGAAGTWSGTGSAVAADAAGGALHGSGVLPEGSDGMFSTVGACRVY